LESDERRQVDLTAFARDIRIRRISLEAVDEGESLRGRVAEDLAREAEVETRSTPVASFTPGSKLTVTVRASLATTSPLGATKSCPSVTKLPPGATSTAPAGPADANRKLPATNNARIGRASSM
jgi:hypothetical protein